MTLFFLLLSKSVTSCVFKGHNGRISRESTDSESHIGRLGYCFVSRHVISQFQSCTDSSSLHTVASRLPERKVTRSCAACVCFKSLQKSPVSSPDSNSSGGGTECTVASGYFTSAVTLPLRF